MMQSLDIYNNTQLCLALSLSDLCTVEPPNYSEVVFSSVVGRGHTVCPLYGGCLLFGVSTIGGSTVYVCRW